MRTDSGLCPFCLSETCSPRKRGVRSICVNNVARVWPKVSHAPVLIRASKVFRVNERPSTRSHNSDSDLKFPFSLRAFKIASTAASPTPLIAASQETDRFAFARGAQKTFRSHSRPAARPRCRTRAPPAMYSLNFSVFAMSLVITSRRKFHGIIRLQIRGLIRERWRRRRRAIC